MQGFYWDVPDGGNWWNTVKAKVTDWSNAGIGAIWLPPASKAQNGAYSMGYDPTDYYDFGNFNQNGSVETRFGSRAELEALITQAHTENMQVYADIVINHNSGGQSEANPYTEPIHGPIFRG
jgi:alpha-amylase